MNQSLSDYQKRFETRLVTQIEIWHKEKWKKIHSRQPKNIDKFFADS